MSTKNNLHAWKIRWREQSKDCEETIIEARTEHEALKNLRDYLILTRGIGYHYLWIVWTMDCSVNQCELTKAYYLMRVEKILGEDE